MWTAQRKDLSRPGPLRLGYHCNREEYRLLQEGALWGEALRVTQLQLRQKELGAAEGGAGGPAGRQEEEEEEGELRVGTLEL